MNHQKSRPAITAIIVAAGAGKRLGLKRPKAFIRLGGKRLFLHSLETFLRHPRIRDAVVVVPAPLVDSARRSTRTIDSAKQIHVVAGGKERWQSVQNGAAATDAEYVLVHDAARPFVTTRVIDSVLEHRHIHDCVITVTPEVDTIRKRSGEMAGDIVDRATLVRVGTPQLFRRSVLLDAFSLAPTLLAPPTDEAALMQQAGVPVALAWGDPVNFKITTAADLAIAKAMLE